MALRTVAVLAFLVASPILLVGLHDVVIGAQLGQRLLGGLLTICSLALLSAAYVSGFRTQHVPMAPALFLAGTIPGLVFLLLQISQILTLRYDWWRILLWLFAMSTPLVAVIVLWPHHKPGGLGIVTNVLSAGLVIAVGQQLLTSYAAPVKRGDSVSVTTQLLPSEQRHASPPPPGQRRSGRERLHGIVSVQNSGDAKLVFLGGIYAVYGYKIGQPVKLDWKELVKQRAWERYQRLSPPTLVAEGLIYDPGTNWIASGVNLKADFLVDVPKDTFDRYKIYALLTTARSDKIITLARTKNSPNQALPDGYRMIPASHGGGISFNALIADPSWVNMLIHGERRVYVAYQNVSFSSSPRVVVCVAVSNCASPQEKPLNFYYGVNLLGAWSWFDAAGPVQ